MSATLSPSTSPKVKRKISVRRPRAISHLPPFTQESHDAALNAIRSYLKSHTSYDSFPVSFRMIVLDAKLEVRKALQCLLSNGAIFLSSLSMLMILIFITFRRCGLGTPLEQRPVTLCRHVYGLGYHTPDTILLQVLHV